MKQLTVYFTFNKSDVSNLLSDESVYDSEIKKRVETIIYEQMRKYTYLFN